MSRGMAHYRLVATRLVEQFPEVVELLRDGRLCMSSVIELAKVITEVNRAEVLPQSFDKFRRGGEAGGGGDQAGGGGAGADGRHQRSNQFNR